MTTDIVVVALVATVMLFRPSRDHETTRRPDPAVLSQIPKNSTVAVDPSAYDPEPVEGQPPTTERAKADGALTVEVEDDSSVDWPDAVDVESVVLVIEFGEVVEEDTDAEVVVWDVVVEELPPSETKLAVAVVPASIVRT